MGYKLHRSRRSMFGRKSRTWLRLLWGLLAVAIVAGGVGLAWLLDRPAAGSVPSSDSEASSTVESSTPDNEPVASQPVMTQPTIEPVRGFTVPLTAVTDTDRLADTLALGANSGFNTVFIDLKDAEGMLYYHFTTPQAKQVNSYAPGALTKDQLTAFIATANEAGLRVMVRLYAFQDHLGAKALAGARVSHTTAPDWVWYDNDPANGGKAWLNPYADEAHLYIIGLCEELKAAGTAGVLLDGVQFPPHSATAGFGSSDNTAMSHSDMLTAFVRKVRTALGEGHPVLLAVTGESALGKKTDVYGGNPLTFDADSAAPKIVLHEMPASVTIGESTIAISPDTPAASLEAVTHHMVLRLKVSGNSTTLTPWVEGDALSPADLAACISGCKQGGTESFILHRTDGVYDFSVIVA